MRLGYRIVPALYFVVVSTAGLHAQTPPEVYGNIWLLVTRDSGLINPSTTNSEDSRNIFEFSMRMTRMGMRWNPAPLDDWTVSSLMEFDFQGGTGTTLQPRVRHAFFCFTRDGLQVLVGQTSDVIAPLIADSINFPAESWPGDIGQRRPMIRGSFRTELGPRTSVTFILAAAQFTQGLENPTTGQVVETAHLPALMGRLTADVLLAGEKAQASLWGHSGQKGYSAHGSTPGGTLVTSSTGLSLLVPMGTRWTFMTELWQGKVGDAAYDPELPRGILSLADVITSRGGWCQLAFKPGPSLRFNMGLGRQFPRSIKATELEAQRISSWYANGFRTLAKRFEVGLELSNWKSNFPGTTRSNNSLRGQLSLRCMF